MRAAADHPRPLLIYLIITVFLACVACASESDAVDRATGTTISDPAPTVMVDIFSGLPNPEFVLSDVETVELRVLLAALEATSDISMSGTDGLGFRGFVVSPATSDGSDPTRLLVTNEGAILNADTANPVMFLDRDKRLYSFLRSAAADDLPPDLVDELPN